MKKIDRAHMMTIHSEDLDHTILAILEEYETGRGDPLLITCDRSKGRIWSASAGANYPRCKDFLHYLKARSYCIQDYIIVYPCKRSISEVRALIVAYYYEGDEIPFGGVSWRYDI